MDEQKAEMKAEMKAVEMSFLDARQELKRSKSHFTRECRVLGGCQRSCMYIIHVHVHYTCSV